MTFWKFCLITLLSIVVFGMICLGLLAYAMSDHHLFEESDEPFAIARINYESDKSEKTIFYLTNQYIDDRNFLDSVAMSELCKGVHGVHIYRKSKLISREYLEGHTMPRNLRFDKARIAGYIRSKKSYNLSRGLDSRDVYVQVHRKDLKGKIIGRDSYIKLDCLEVNEL